MAAAVDEIRARGNAAFKRRDYAAAVQHYTAALEALSSSTAGSAACRLPLLTNRALAAHRLGDYAAASQDAEAALGLDAANSKAAFRAAAARLALGDVAATARHAALLQPARGVAAQALPAGWAALQQHAAALLAHQQRVEACKADIQQQGNGQAVRQAVGRLLQVLAAEAAGEEEEDGAELPAGGAAALLEQLAGMLNSAGSGGGEDTPATPAVPAAAAAAAAAAMDAAPGQRGWRLLLFFLADPDPRCQAGAAAALQAAALAAGGGGSVIWPAEVWHRLAAAATNWSGGSSTAAPAMQLLAWAAERDAWVRQQLLTHPLPAEGASSAATVGAGRLSPLAQLVGVLGDAKQLRHAPPAAAAAAAALLQHYGHDPVAAEALRVLACRPLLALLRATAGVDGMAAFAQEEKQQDGTGAHAPGGAHAPASGAAGGGSSTSSHLDPEQEALEALRRKLAAVYIAEAVALRQSLLSAACQLARGAHELLLQEAVDSSSAGGSSSSGGGAKRGVAAGAFLIELLDWVRELHSQQPRRTQPVLGPDGAPRAYAKRRFAADFKDNPAGDFLLSLDLQDGGDSGGPAAASGVGVGGDDVFAAASGSGGASKDSQRQRQQQQQPTLLDLSLRLLEHAAAASPAAAALLYRRDLFALCDELCTYCTPAVVAAGQRLFAAVADRVAAAAEEVVQGGMPPSLAALLLHSGSADRRVAALGKLAAVADTCSGDDFALLCGVLPGQGGGGGGGRAAAEAARAAALGSAVHSAWQLAGGEQAKAQAAGGGSGAALQRAALRFLLRCLERAQRQQGLRPEAAPRGGGWGAIGRAPLEALLLRERQQAQQPQQPQQQEADGLEKLKRGFFAKPAPKATGAAKPPLPSRGAAAGTSSGASPGAVPPAAAPSSGPPPAGGSAATSTYKSGSVTIEELPAEEEEEQARQAADSNGVAAPPSPPPGAGRQPAAPAPAAPAVAAAGQRNTVTAEEWAEAEAVSESGDSSEDDVPDLADVYDSSTCLPAEVRRARADWLATPMEKKLRWIQTSSDVSVTLALPPGTRAADVSVSAAGGRLAVGLRWYGSVYEGALHRPVKISETHWCLDSGELQILLAKGDASWWKMLVEGGEEKAYVDILKEAVDADEPVQPYDEMDEKAKDLLDAIHERQAYINAGLIDPDGFDDFRVVIGENNLKPPGSGGL